MCWDWNSCSQDRLRLQFECFLTSFIGFQKRIDHFLQLNLSVFANVSRMRHQRVSGVMVHLQQTMAKQSEKTAPRLK